MLSAAVLVGAIGPCVVWSWPVPAMLAVLPGLLAALLISTGTPTALDRGAMVTLVGLTAVLPLNPGVLGVADLVEAELDAWVWRLSLIMPVVIAILAVDAPTVRRLFTRPLVWWFGLAGWALVVSPLGAAPATSALAAVEIAALGVAAGWATTRLRPRLALSLVGAGAAAFSVVSLCIEILAVDVPTIFGPAEGTGLGFARLTGLAGEPIQLAEIAGVAAVAVMAVASARRYRHLGVGEWLTLGVGVAAVVASQSRAALAALAAAFIWMVLRRRAGTAMVTGAAVVGIAGLVIVISGIGPASLTDLVDLRDDSAGSNGRIESVWPAAFDQIAERPITGWGVTGGEVAMRQEMEAGETTFILARSAHNRFIETALALGVIGLVILAVFAVELASVVRSPGLEGVLVYLVIVGLTGPGSGAAFVSADEMILVVVAAVLLGAAGREAGADRNRNRIDTDAYFDSLLFG